MDSSITILIKSANTFFESRIRNKLKLDKPTAISVCRQCEEHGLLVFRIEGGIWWGSKFEVRLDSIWDGCDLPCDRNTARKNNLLAEKFVEAEPEEYNAFIITSVRF